MSTFQGAIFDVDGVLVDSPHEKAWREALRELMESDWRDIRDRTTWTPEAFTPHVYQEYMSGKPRASGARAALDYFKVPDAADRVAAYGQRKQDILVRLIGRRLPCLSRRTSVRHRDQRRGPADRRCIVIKERGAVPGEDPPRHIRAAA